jgi:glycosyltransferase involved in cell wall biosynthesis
VKIAYISSSEYPSKTANSIQVIRQSNGMAQVGFEVSVLARLKRNSMMTIEQIRIHYNILPEVDLRLMFDIRGVPRFVVSSLFPLWVSLNIPKDVSLIYSRHMLGVFFASLFYRNLVLIYESHGIPNRYELVMLRLLCKTRKLNRIVAISGALKTILLKKFKYLKNIDIIVSHDACEPSPDNRIINAGLSVGYVGGFYRGRGLDLIAKLATRLPYVAFHIAGGEKSEFERFSGFLASDNIIFHGHVPPSKLAEVYSLFSIALAPYSQRVEVPDGSNTVKYMSPLKIFEYMGQGKAIIASDLPVLREILEDGISAILAKPDDADSWENAIIKLKDPKLRKHIGDLARKEALDKYTWFARAKQIVAI